MFLVYVPLAVLIMVGIERIVDYWDYDRPWKQLEKYLNKWYRG